MPAVTVVNTLVLPKLMAPGADRQQRAVAQVVMSRHVVEGAGFAVWRPFPGTVDAAVADPFFLLDQLGPTEVAPNEGVGAPWHPHRGFETVSYVIDGAIAHHDSNGGGGLISDGDTQWMTAGSGILHDEVPSEAFLHSGGRSHAVQLWVNLPAALKFTPPRYQSITKDRLTLLSSADGGALVRLIAGDLGGHAGPGATHTPITYAHVTLHPGAELSVPWEPTFNAMAYMLSGGGVAGRERRPMQDHELVVFGPGDAITVAAEPRQAADVAGLDLLLLGGLPIREPIAHYGPFLMNTRQQLVEAIEDFNAGRLGRIPAATVDGG